METSFRPYWRAVTAEAVRRRKAQKLTQAEVASLAGVSLPTLIKFETGSVTVRAKIALRILEVLGL